MCECYVNLLIINRKYIFMICFIIINTRNTHNSYSYRAYNHNRALSQFYLLPIRRYFSGHIFLIRNSAEEEVSATTGGASRSSSGSSDGASPKKMNAPIATTNSPLPAPMGPKVI